MSNDILDEDWHDTYEGDIVVVKYFYQESEAELYAIRLRTAGIQTFVANGASQSMLPLGAGWISLHVRQEDLPAALEIVAEMDRADGQKSKATNDWQWVLVTLLILLVLIFGRVVVRFLFGI